MIRPYDLFPPTGPAVPVVFDSPHSGRGYPDDFRPAAPIGELLRGEDRFVDRLFAGVPALGATLLAARFPRCYLDANRKRDDIDPDLLADAWPGQLAPGAKSRLGKGLVWRFVRPGVPVYDRLLTAAEVEARIATCWAPYHAALADAIGQAVAAFGAAWHLDCHSMPAVSDALSPEGAGARRPDMVLGDGGGVTCTPAFTRFVGRILEEMGYSVAVNHPYRGAELVHAHSDPAGNRHSLQLEINRGLYLDETSNPSAGFPRLAADMQRLSQAICAFAVV